LSEHGWRGLADADFSNYPPAYLYLLWFSTLFSRWFSPLISFKIIPTFFDMISTVFVFLIARQRHKVDVSLLLASIFFLLPTVMINSTAWGQVDSLYVSFLLGCVYFLLLEKPVVALILFGVSISFKAQAVFLLPFLGILLLKGRISWWHFFLVPAVYLILGLPAALIGRSWQSILTIYLGQVGQFEDLAKNAPNPYLFIPNRYYHPVVEIGMMIFLGVLAFWGWVSWKSRAVLTQYRLLFMALANLAMVPYLLPKMHDRYFYPADVFSFVVAVFHPEMWFLPVLYQLMSSLAYTNFLFNWPQYYVMIAALINTILVIYIFRKYISNADGTHDA
jgi:Gpi18-like mannosyltransferase